VDYIKDMKGKEIAYAVAADLSERIAAANGIVAFFGGYGVGKSGLLKALVASATLRQRKARYLHAESMLTRIRSSYNDNSSEVESNLMEEFATLPVLALDEVDRISTTPWALSHLMTILDRRYEARDEVLTLLATNAHMDNLPEAFSYLQSRLKDGKRVPLGGEELRGRGADRG
jgi:DNA replication protein DnaC